jgi:hypothetical protein
VVSGRIVGDVDDDLIHNAHAAPVLTLRVKLASAFVPMERRKQMDSAAVVELRRYLNLKRTTALRVGRTAGESFVQSRYLPGFVSGIPIQSKPVAAAAAAAKITKPAK